ncbi:hypothetical protein KORDIASMS9_01318 [Kordia sp. SMS9]|uniref:hypothetical protein n=1 Tax=Kordia sp. SMS9 TaxID=2282170 RepID=UPI000E0E0747|nr:hypothetical protein [Kordia sp. SMS9]AXG69099.1 hypothetical protein KORDIASMS9_01318 [Kordia sp. SMS9]
MNFKTSFICLIFLFIAACSLQKSIYKNETTIKELRKNSNATIDNWDNTVSAIDFYKEVPETYIPESGVRGRYALYDQFFSIATLETIVGESVFLKGPHTTSPNYKSDKAFGYYNPLFIKKLEDNLRFVFKNKTFVKGLQAHYDSNLKKYIRTYYLSYKVAANNQEIMNGYLDAIADPEKHDYMNGRIKGPSFYLQEKFRDFAESQEKNGYDVYEAFTCPGFWIRRSIDGTADEFYEVLKLTLETFDPTFMAG